MIAPIETRYAGCRFRSRLEARWAVFFDHLGISWRYEPQGYIVGGKPYLPDFLVHPDSPRSFWLEVKGVHPTDEELEKAQGLASATKLPVFVRWGDVETPPTQLAQVTGYDEYVAGQGPTCRLEWDNREGWQEVCVGQPAAWKRGLTPTAYRLDPPHRDVVYLPRSASWWWTDCHHCGHVILKMYGQIGYCPSFNEGGIPRGHQLYPSFGHATPRLIAAYVAARSARFEHGESGT